MSFCDRLTTIGFMKPMVVNLSQKDMIDLAAYVGSLKP